MLIGVVSDTHAEVEYTRRAVRMLESLQVQAVLHCGDIGSAAIVPLFASWPTHFVFGNVDVDRGGLQRAIEAAEQTCHGAFGSLELAGRKIALMHGDDARRFREEIASGRWDLLCYGHTHVAKQEQIGPTLVLNPGAVYRAESALDRGREIAADYSNDCAALKSLAATQSGTRFAARRG